MKITNSMTKVELVESMQEVMGSKKYVLENKTLVDMVNYTLKKFKEKASNVLKADLLDIATELMEYIQPQAVAVENKIKVAKAKKEEPKETTEPEKETKKPVKKAKASKVEKKEVLFELPAKLETEIGDYSLVTGELATLKEVSEAMEKGREIVFATYWSKKLLKQYPYSTLSKFNTRANKVAFPQDFDISKPVYFTEDLEGVFALSHFTEVMGFFDDIALDEVEGVRYINNAEWGMYELIEEPEIKEVAKK